MAKQENGKKQISKADAKAMWDTVRKTSAAVKQAEEQLQHAMQRRSNAVKAVAEAMGNGPFEVKDLGLVTIRTRQPTEKDEKGEKVKVGDPTYFVVSMGQDKEVMVID